MHVCELIEPNRILSSVRAASKKQLLQELAQCVADRFDLEERTVFDVLVERERLGSTGVGHGVAIPHGKLESLDQIFGFFVRLPKPIDFDAIDEEPVDLVFLLLAPETAGADHLKALAGISRLLRDPEVCEKLRGATNDEALYALLMTSETSPDGQASLSKAS